MKHGSLDFFAWMPWAGAHRQLLGVDTMLTNVNGGCYFGLDQTPYRSVRIRSAAIPVVISASAAAVTKALAPQT